MKTKPNDLRLGQRTAQVIRHFADTHHTDGEIPLDYDEWLVVLICMSMSMMAQLNDDALCHAECVAVLQEASWRTGLPLRTALVTPEDRVR